MAGVLVILEQRDGALKRVSHEVLTAGRGLADGLKVELHALIVGPAGVATDRAAAYGADQTVVVADDALKLYQADRYAAAAAERAKAGGYAAVLVSATAMGKDLAPRVAARLGAALASDVTSLRFEGGVVVTRPVYAGKGIYTLKLGAPCVISLRPNSVAPVEAKRAGVVERVAAPAGAPRARTIEVKQPERAALDVAEAGIVVSGGRGLKEPQNFQLIEDLASALGGAVGASRAVVDAGWRPHAEQVGQTGKTVSPSLYFAIGISGAIQHLAGMRTAKVIVAINKDADAPIFKVADYGIVGDLFEILPRLTAEIKQLKEA